MFKYRLSYDHNGQHVSCEGKEENKRSGVDVLWDRLTKENGAVILVDVEYDQPHPTRVDLLKLKGYSDISIVWL